LRKIGAAVEHAAVQRHQRDQQQIRKRDPRQGDRKFAPDRIIGKSRRQNADHLRHEQPRDGEQHHLRQQQQREDAVGEQPRPLRTAFAIDVGVGRHECRVERAFREDRPEVIGQAKRHEKRVRHRSGTEDRRQHDVAREAG
jgi:hypothetical protein